MANQRQGGLKVLNKSGSAAFPATRAPPRRAAGCGVVSSAGADTGTGAVPRWQPLPSQQVPVKARHVPPTVAAAGKNPFFFPSRFLSFPST